MLLKFTKLAIYWVVFFSFCQKSNGQITINMPVERSVFQRVNNVAAIQIGGFSSINLPELQIQLTVIQGGTAINWTTILTNLSIGPFRCELKNVQAGWYKLQIRGYSGTAQIGDITTVNKIGVGEVFFIAGQSNAQGGQPPEGGFNDQTAYGADDDRVNGIDFYDNLASSSLQLPIITKIAPQTNLSPRGKASWCWAALGDLIAQNWNVPVLFFNAANGATKVGQWSNAADGLPVYDYYSNVPNTYITDGWPYIYLKKSLNYYGKIYGVRAVLWHQGEDNLAYFDDAPYIATNFQNDLENVVNKSRIHFGKNISWLIAQVSRVGNNTNLNLKNRQKAVAEKVNFNAFLGPDTDLIQPSAVLRDANVHFHGTGLLELAQSWFISMNESFLANSNPIIATNNLGVENNNFVFENSLPQCNGPVLSLSSGQWNNPNTWSCGHVPTIADKVLINENHVIEINSVTALVKNIILRGTINYANGGQLMLNE